MNIKKVILDQFKSQRYCIKTGSGFTTIMCDGELINYQPSVVATEDGKLYTGRNAMFCDKANIINPIQHNVISNIRETDVMIGKFTKYISRSQVNNVLLSVSPCDYGNSLRAMCEMFAMQFPNSEISMIETPLAAYHYLRHHYKLEQSILLIDITSDSTMLSIVCKSNILVHSMELNFGWNDCKDESKWYKKMLCYINIFIEKARARGVEFGNSFLISDDKDKRRVLNKLSNILALGTYVPADFHLIVCKGMDMAYKTHPHLFYTSHNREMSSNVLPISQNDIYLYMERIGEIYEANFEPHSLRNKVKIIATSGGAKNALSSFCRQYKGELLQHIDCIALYDDDNAYMRNSYPEIPNRMIMGDTIINTNDSTLLDIAFGAMLGDCTSYVVLLNTAGGRNSVSRLLIEHLKHTSINVIVLTTLPFAFEGEKKRILADNQIKLLAAECSYVELIDAEELRKAHPNLSFINAFTLLDEYIVNSLKEIVDVCIKELGAYWSKLVHKIGSVFTYWSKIVHKRATKK